ncbi:heme ABC transporter ATP-binding protein/permease CydC [Avibacterium paragallinarum]|uniref:Glutathione/L-cysteine transport system ATP-binding/permease protein CydC n=2 Tax=Avibacterium paragallinarum TaxID=728 RepID=A0AAE5TJV7_AVIPA|nr:cysteine/glutathione ABC transporter ATP-binding protein/permease CydC [Avibacterium paragallinarum]MEE3609005.1 cysteine/glutathione ABC transporter ATP-binding protein/permease CydC [Avibacterium paragallinarum]MEE3621224.1 cysteine/glutathione ABC transporter ATP-binding protein/permease CydC [Avibacterium paragallinarum]MEE3668522.1 cysteine/glutathione ABC transporter ATP-binding protein/permease CydC [Avibacterium paragallinarum]MEE3681211.1 cysteine/glutathione ABC transporter ATP-bin
MRTLLPFLRLFKHAKFVLFLGLLLMITGLAASIGLLTVSGWFLAATALAGAGSLFNFFYPSATVRGLAIGRTVARYFEKIVTHDATFRILAKLRVQVFKKIIPLSPAVLNRYRNSDLLNRLVADVDTLDSLYLRLLAPFSSAVVVIGFLTLGLSLFNLTLGLSFGGILLVLVCVIPTLFYHLGKKFGHQLTHARAAYRTQFVEFIQSQAELLLFNAEQPLKDKLDATEQQWQQLQQKEANLSGFSTALMILANGLLLVFTLWFAADADFGNDQYSPAIIALFALAALAAFEILMPLGAAFLHIGQVMASAQRITDITDQAPLVQFHGEKTLEKSTALSIKLQDLFFTYPERQDIALEKINLDIPQGRKIAILGKTGSGKSTLLQLLVRNYDPAQGKIFLADQPIESYTEPSLREQICFLTQRIHIFSDTLRNNLQLANQQVIQDEAMIEVLSQVGLGKLLNQEEGLDLWLGDGGRPLSGGEQRRLGLARVLLNQAPILLLDEPTEGLDRETERQMLQLILNHSKDKTLMMVTHRLTAIEQFDCLCVIDEGKLIERGDYQTLITKENGFFRQLVERI